MRVDSARCRVALLFLLLLPCGLHAQVLLDIQGVSDELAENVRLTVGQPARSTERSIERYIERIPEQAKRAMSALGYYAAEVRVRRLRGSAAERAIEEADVEVSDAGAEEMENAGNDDPQDQADARDASDGDIADGDASDGDAEPPAGPSAVVRIDITPNDPVRITEVTINIEGPARLDGAFMSAVSETQLRRGAVFVSTDYEATKGVLFDRAQDLGYFDFAFTTNTVRVSRRRLTADIELVADSGPRYTFGTIKFEQDIFAESFLSRWVPFEEGEPYSATQVAELTENLQRSGYFASVRVLPQRDRRYGTTVPVIVRLERSDPNQVGVGIGYATDVGPRTKLTWAKPLINRLGHSAEVELGLSEPRQNISFSYRIPRKNQPMTNYWGIQYGLRNEDDEDTKSFLSTLNFERVRRTGSDWTESLFIRWERELFTVSGREIETDLVLPGFSYSRTRSRGTPFPEWGQSTSFQFTYGSEQLLSSIDFYKSLFTFRYLQAFYEKNALIFALQYGAIRSNKYDEVPVSQRFFAGGDRSIRGFGWKEVSPRDANDEAIGGRYLEVLNLEYNYRFLDRWSAAIFTDVGRAFNDFDSAYSAGAGVGIRWQSPVGPFRLDVARPVSNGDGEDWRLHLSLGPDI